METYIQFPILDENISDLKLNKKRGNFHENFHIKPAKSYIILMKTFE